jgi:hypothetical protein
MCQRSSNDNEVGLMALFAEDLTTLLDLRYQ